MELEQASRMSTSIIYFKSTDWPALTLLAGKVFRYCTHWRLTMKKQLLFPFAALLIILSQPAISADYSLDITHTQIKFAVSHLGFSTSRGSFREFSGNYSFDPAAPEASSVEVVIQTASVDLDDEEWNSHLRAAQWFNVEQFPTMTFKSTSVESAGEGQFIVKGDLTLLGITKPVALDAKLNKIGDQMGKPKSGFSASATIDRRDWGLKTFAPMIGAQVSINLEIEGFEVK